MKRSGVSILVLGSLCATAFVSAVYAHEGHEHHHLEAKLPPSEAAIRQATLHRIGRSYAEEVEPTFRKACFDCHSSTPRLPWYYKIPIAKQLIDHDIRESKEHLDFTDGYPFKGHGTPDEDLKAIAEVIAEGSMPPFRYRILHSTEKLTSEERKAILRWARESAKLLSGSDLPLLVEE